MKIRKQWSSNYQVFELEEEVADLDVAKTIGTLMEEVAKDQLAKMVETVKQFADDNNSSKSVQVKEKDVNLLSAKQATTIKNQFKRAVGVASKLGITLSSYDDVDKLTSKQASEIIGEFFKNNEKKDLGV